MGVSWERRTSNRGLSCPDALPPPELWPQALSTEGGQGQEAKAQFN